MTSATVVGFFLGGGGEFAHQVTHHIPTWAPFKTPQCVKVCLCRKPRHLYTLLNSNWNSHTWYMERNEGTRSLNNVVPERFLQTCQVVLHTKDSLKTDVDEECDSLCSFIQRLELFLLGNQFRRWKIEEVNTRVRPMIDVLSFKCKKTICINVNVSFFHITTPVVDADGFLAFECKYHFQLQCRQPMELSRKHILFRSTTEPRVHQMWCWWLSRIQTTGLCSRQRCNVFVQALLFFNWCLNLSSKCALFSFFSAGSWLFGAIQDVVTEILSWCTNILVYPIHIRRISRKCLVVWLSVGTCVLLSPNKSLHFWRPIDRYSRLVNHLWRKNFCLSRHTRKLTWKIHKNL